MKICLICNEFPPMPHGGIGVFIKTMAEALQRSGEDVYVVGYGKNVRRPLTLNGVKVHWLTLPSLMYKKIQLNGQSYSAATFLKRIYLSIFLNWFCLREKIDLVETHDFSGPLAFKPPCRTITRLHGSIMVYRHLEGRSSIMHPVDAFYEKKQVMMADDVIAVSNHIALATREVMGLNQPFQVIYNGVNVDRFRPSSGVKEQKQILFVGRIMWRKGAFDLIRCVPGVLNRHGDAKFVLAGAASGSHLEQLHQELARLSPKNQEKIKLPGVIPHDSLAELMNQSSVFVFPSRVEAFGLTCIEAMACGCPVVATRLASGPELVEDGVTGLLANPTDPYDLALKINTLLDDPDLGARLGSLARQRVIEKFDLRTLALRNLNFYQSTLR